MIRPARAAPFQTSTAIVVPKMAARFFVAMTLLASAFGTEMKPEHTKTLTPGAPAATPPRSSCAPQKNPKHTTNQRRPILWF